MTVETFNYGEAALWFTIGTGMLIAAIIRRKEKEWVKVYIIATFAFFLFGVSDLIEAKTGAWWKPRGLLVLNGICILAFIGCYLRAKKLGTKNGVRNTRDKAGE